MKKFLQGVILLGLGGGFQAGDGLAQSSGAAPVPMTIKVFPLQFADPESVRQAVAPMVEPEGRVTLSRADRSLVIMTEPDRMEDLRKVIQRLDRIPPNVRIEVDMDGASSSRRTGASLGLQSEIIIGNGTVKGRGILRPEVTHRQSSQQQAVQQSLLVSSGRSARLEVGREVPYARYFYRFGLQHGLLETEIHWRPVGSSLVIEPTVIGEGPMIRVRVIPEIRAEVEGRVEEFQYTSVATEITVRDGETVRIGGMHQHEDFYSRFLVGGDQGGTSRQMQLRLTPRIENTARSSSGP